MVKWFVVRAMRACSVSGNEHDGRHVWAIRAAPSCPKDSRLHLSFYGNVTSEFGAGL